MQTQNLHASDAAAVHFGDRKAEAGVFEAFPAARNEAEPAQDESADGRVAGIFRQGDAVLRVEVADVERSIEDHRAIGQSQRMLDDVELIVDFADHLFEDILEGHQAENAAKLVHNKRQAGPPCAQLAEKLAGRLGFGNDQDFAQEPPEVEVQRRKANACPAAAP